jgi:hypothetical protein
MIANEQPSIAGPGGWSSSSGSRSDDREWAATHDLVRAGG